MKRTAFASLDQELKPLSKKITHPMKCQPQTISKWSLTPWDPDEQLMIHHVADMPTFIKEVSVNHEENPLVGLGSTAQAQSERKPFYPPFLNSTVFWLMSWFYNTSIKTLTDLDALVSEVLLSNVYNQEDLMGFSAIWESHHLDKSNPQQDPKNLSKSSSPPLPVDNSDF